MTVDLVALVLAVLRYAGAQGDFGVYHVGASTWLAGGELYGQLPYTSYGQGWPFTYPPIAAVLFSPFTLLSYPAASVVFTALTGLVLLLCLVLLGRELRAPWWLAPAVLPAALFLDPVHTTFGFGQINLVLLALVLMDCLARTPHWPRGLLVGLAAGIKLTPLVFLLFFLLRGHRQAIWAAAGTFASTVVLGFLAAPSDAWRYWTSALFQTDRVGRADAPGNASLRGLIASAKLPEITQTLLWLGAIALVLTVAVGAMRRSLEAGLPGHALVANAFAGLLITPVSWYHHWVWALPAIAVLAAAWWHSRDRFTLWLTGIAAVLFVLPVPGKLSTGYVFYALLVLICLSCGLGLGLRAHQAQREHRVPVPVG
ncbi:alpha-1,2-mannosyltransferase [Crossiella equi]|uniref:Alpha-1,2-mannosyltransferase n=1 Tax=Crossiella equi TaxID=130796 RepID=A0ABS5A6V2_9PSEU|nr:glycosyltransferase 87 family protein [Crossiella equi]MBP2472327.1 alpha-1,2-mannosyltransferase [Crossiella equi]